MAKICGVSQRTILRDIERKIYAVCREEKGGLLGDYKIKSGKIEYQLN